MKSLLKLISICLVILLVLFLYARFIEPMTLNIHYENLSSDLISTNLDEIRIIQFTDTHISKYFDETKLSRVVERINELNPHIVIFTGDLIDHYNSLENKDIINQVMEILANIEAPLGKYATYGNHDYGGGAEKVYEKIMNNSGFVTLRNESVLLENQNINIIGLDDSIFGKVNKTLSSDYINPNNYNIVLSHEPDIIDSLLDYNIDLFLSGHSHGGQVNLPFIKYMPKLANNYTKGMYVFENHRTTKLYVNIGIGTSILPLRFMAPPEITVFKISTNKVR